MDIILLPLKLFAFNPIAVFAVAIIFSAPVFLKVYGIRAKIILTIVAVTRWVYAFWELYMTQWRSETGDMAIRVDLVLFGPVILLVAIIGILVLIFDRVKKA